jgi:hypothetical protein
MADTLIPAIDLHWLTQEELDAYRAALGRPRPPKFASLEEADTWLEAHAP